MEAAPNVGHSTAMQLVLPRTWGDALRDSFCVSRQRHAVVAKDSRQGVGGGSDTAFDPDQARRSVTLIGHLVGG